MNQDIITIKQIINVNYAGEYGAIRLYQAQIFIAQFLHKPLLAMLAEIKQDEQQHCKIFRIIMPEYGLRPCRLTWIWGAMGCILGIGTALLGQRALMLCIKAAEETAHTHLWAQMQFLEHKDRKLFQLIEEVYKEELKHCNFSEAYLKAAPLSQWERYFYTMIYQICQATMWVVTQGASVTLLDKLQEKPVA